VRGGAVIQATGNKSRTPPPTPAQQSKNQQGSGHRDYELLKFGIEQEGDEGPASPFEHWITIREWMAGQL